MDTQQKQVEQPAPAAMTMEPAKDTTSKQDDSVLRLRGGGLLTDCLA